MSYRFNVKNLFNLITYPKHGCTQISQWVAECGGRAIDYEQHRCQNVHGWYKKYSGQWNSEKLTYAIYRLPHERALSYYLSNYSYAINGRHKNYNNLSFLEFVDNLPKIQKLDRHHLGSFSPKIKSLIKEGKILEFKLLNLKDFNSFTEEQQTLNNLPSLRGRTINNSSWDYFLYSEAMKLAGFKNYQSTDYFNLKYSQFHGKAAAAKIDATLLKKLKQSVLSKDKVTKEEVLSLSTDVQKIVKQNAREEMYVLTDRNNFFNEDIINQINYIYKEDYEFIEEALAKGLCYNERKAEKVSK